MKPSPSTTGFAADGTVTGTARKFPLYADFSRRRKRTVANFPSFAFDLRVFSVLFVLVDSLGLSRVTTCSL